MTGDIEAKLLCALTEAADCQLWLIRPNLRFTAGFTFQSFQKRQTHRHTDAPLRNILQMEFFLDNPNVSVFTC